MSYASAFLTASTLPHFAYTPALRRFARTAAILAQAAILAATLWLIPATLILLG